MKNTILIVFMTVLCFSATASPHSKSPLPVSSWSKYVLSGPAPSFVFLRGHKQGGGYGLQWAVTNDSDILYFDVESTYEDPNDPYSNWYHIGQVTNSKSRVYKFTTYGALPGIITYRVIAVLSNYTETVVSPFYMHTIQ